MFQRTHNKSSHDVNSTSSEEQENNFAEDDVCVQRFATSLQDVISCTDPRIRLWSFRNYGRIIRIHSGFVLTLAKQLLVGQLCN
jgi:hypothetical protein